MPGYYSIVEVAALLGIPAQTLRFYATQGLVQPRSVDERTGCRYYTADQFPQIDSISHLQKFGMSLPLIREAMENGYADDLLHSPHQNKHQRDLDSINETVADLNWYVSYYLGG
jgi:DNA-binding transcriptional MerR regulator